VKVVLFGATGMIGSGALIECLAHPDVEAVLAVGRRSSGVVHEKLSEVLQDDFLDYSAISDRLRVYDACLFCLGVSAAGMSEAEYTRVTHDFTVAAAEAFFAMNPDRTFCYISGQGADSTERGRVMWARVRGRLENRLLGMGLGPVWIFRPGFVQPKKGVRSSTTLYNAIYAVLGPIYPLLETAAPKHVTSSDRLGLALIRAARDGAPKAILGNAEINALAELERARVDA
jgi:uncharacterized protein YbjT (DUF2867 family)